MKILEKIENVLKTIILKYWYVDMTITVIAFVILLIIERYKQRKVQNSE